MGQALQADYVLVGEVQNAPYLILAMNLVMRETKSGHMVRGLSVDVRSKTDRSWRRGMRFILSRLFFSPNIDLSRILDASRSLVSWSMQVLKCVAGKSVGVYLRFKGVGQGRWQGSLVPSIGAFAVPKHGFIAVFHRTLGRIPGHPAIALTEKYNCKRAITASNVEQASFEVLRSAICDLAIADIWQPDCPRNRRSFCAAPKCIFWQVCRFSCVRQHIDKSDTFTGPKSIGGLGCNCHCSVQGLRYRRIIGDLPIRGWFLNVWFGRTGMAVLRANERCHQHR